MVFGAGRSLGSTTSTNTASVREQPSTASEPQSPQSTSAEALVGREGSGYEGLSAAAAEAVLQETHGGAVSPADGGPPPLPEGWSATGFPSDDVESISDGDQKAVVQSFQPLALEVKGGARRAVDLSLHEAEGSFEPVFGLAPVRLGRSAGEGASLQDSGVSLTPVSEQDGVLNGGGAIDHAGVFYGDTEDEGAGVRDLSMFAKPTLYGFEWFDVLFGARSPEHLLFRVGLPNGATLVEDASGRVEVLREGVVLAVILRPAALDAAGTPVEVSVGVAGDVIELSVPHNSGVRYPILLDPTVEDKTLPKSSNPCGENGSNWCFFSEPPGQFKFFEYEESGSATAVGQHMEMLYKARGESKVYRLELNSYSEVPHARSTLEIVKNGGGGEENGEVLGNNVSSVHNESSLCAKRGEAPPSCSTSTETNGNSVRFQQTANEAFTNMGSSIAGADVYVSQEAQPTVTFNRTEPKIKVEEPNGTVVERENALYPGTKELWIGPYTNTAFEMIDKDPGVGLRFVAASSGGWSREVFLQEKEGKCTGVWCPEEYKGKFTYYTTTPGFETPLPSGEDNVQGRAEDSVRLSQFGYATVWVDAEAPQSIKLVGLPAGYQFGEGVYKIKAEATDGKTGVPSSGVQSLKLGIDGALAGEPRGSCSAGPCTASAEWTINGGLLSAGPHVLTVVATDNAGNIGHEDFVIFVHHASPVGLGPGSLDPQSGNFSLGASDVSMGPGLTLTRAYSSRNLTAGVEGGLGPQWTASLGGSESLEELADGSMVLTSASRGETTFQRNSKGELESPQGDANVALSAQVNSKGVPTAYYLKDVAAGTTTKFARAEGYLQTAPSYYGEIGWQDPGMGQLNAPMGVASDAKGDAWVADTKNDRIEQFNPEGEYVSQFGGGGGPYNGELKEPRGVAIDAKGDIWVADTGNNRIEEFNEKGEFVRVAGTEGAGALKGPQGIATDASGNVWVADTGDNRVVEFNEKGEYALEASKTVGTRTLSEPVGVAVDTTGDVWATDAKNHRVVEFSPAGAALKEVGKEGTGNGEFKTPTGIAIDSENDVYVSDYVADRVQEFGAKGEYLTKFGSAGSGGAQFKAPYLISVDAQGALLVADSENSRVQRWAHAAWLPAVSEGPVATSEVSYTYKAVRAASGTLIEPTEVLAPHPAELSCAPTIKAGCRALFLKYAAKTTASESAWGEYEGRLSEVLFAAYNPASKLVEEKVVVARYAYDGKGRLRAEWDPRVKPELKTVYGYDVEGHVTAVSPAEQEPWLIHYGTIPTDASPGRVLSVIRPAASTAIASQPTAVPSNTTRPTLSSSEPKVGVKISVSSNGAWSNSPLTYGYQWERCSPGAECAAIAGAVNEAYYPTAGDEKDTLVVQVTALNAGGATIASSVATGPVGTGTPNSPAPEPPNPGTNAVTTVEYALPVSGTGLPDLLSIETERWGEKKDVPVEGTAVFPPAKPMGWPAKEYQSATISYFDAQGRTVNVVNPAGGIATTEYDETNNAVRTLSADNRALALKEGAKSVEVAAKLDSRMVYNEEGDELLETLGPEHKVKLPSGKETQARHRVKYVYDQNAPKGETYRLVTETTEAAVVEGREEDRRVTQTHYSGQQGLGWALRKPTSVTVDPYGLKLTTTTIYNPMTGAVVETGTAKGVQEKETEKATYQESVGSYGAGNGQFNNPVGLAVDGSGDVWVADWGNGRVQKFNSKGEFLKAFGTHGPEPGQMEGIEALATDSHGNVWIAEDYGLNRVEEFTSEGAYVKSVGSTGSGEGQFNTPSGLSVDSKGDVFVADRGNRRVEELNAEGKYVRSFARSVEDEGPFDVQLDSKGDLWVSYAWDEKVVEYSPEGVILEEWGTKGTAAGQLEDAYRIQIGPEGNIWLAEWGNDRIQVFTPSGEYLYGFGSYGSGPGQFWHARGIGFYGTTIYALDSGEAGVNSNARIELWRTDPPARYMSSAGSYGSGNGQFNNPVGLAVDGSGDVWVADWGNGRVQKFNSKGEFLKAFGTHGPEPGQMEGIEAIATDSHGNVWIAEDYGLNRVEEFTSEGVYIKSFGSTGSGEGQFSYPSGLAIDAKGDIFVADRGNRRVQELNAEGKYVRSFARPAEDEGPFDVQLDSKGDLWVSYAWDSKIVEYGSGGAILQEWGTKGTAAGQLEDAYRIQIGPEGNIWVAEWGNNRVQVFTPSGEYLYGFGSYGSGPGQFWHARGIGFYGTTIYALDSGEAGANSNSRIEEWQITKEIWNSETSREVVDSETVHDRQTIYYSAAPDGQYPSCGGHAEWEGMPCITRPGAQPTGSPAPSLPTTTINSYNMWGEPETTTETFPATEKVSEATRTKRIAYDEAGRPQTSEQTSSSSTDKTLPKVTTAESYGEVCGQTKPVRCVTQSTTEGETTQTITSIYDTLGRLLKYTDADSNTTTYEYEPSGDGRLLTVSDPKGSQSYAYDPTTGELTKLLDSAAKTFIASYDVEGNMTSDTYPNGMTATYTRDPAGEATGIEYLKTTDCTEKCVWFNETTVPSIHGETLSRTSTLTNDAYTYDAVGRLTQTTETPVGGKGCVTRLYGYDEESNRTSLTTREPGLEGKCASEGGATEAHTYDAANRLSDTGTSYDPLGNTTKLPAADAGGHELTSEYYVDGQMFKQSQNGQTNTYYTDPAGRVRKTVGEGTTSVTAVSHYAGAGEALSWKDEGSGKYTRLIPGIDGTLCATQANGETPVLQLHDLQGDIVATANLSETETKLSSTYNSTEFGVQVNGAPPTKYSWLGAAGVSSELSSGTLVEGTVAYQPQLGRALQTQAVIPPGMAINGATQTVAYHAQISAWEITSGNEAASRHAEEGAAEEAAAAREANEKIVQQCREEGGCGELVDPECTIKIEVVGSVSSTGKEWVNARAWGWCHGIADLPTYSELEVCLIAEVDSDGPEAPALANCKVDGSGWNFEENESAPRTSTLYKQAHMPCLADTAYVGWAWLWIPGMKKGIEKYAPKAWRCGLRADEWAWEFAVTLYGVFPTV